MRFYAEKSNRTDGDKIIAAVQIVDPATGKVVMIAPDVGLRYTCILIRASYKIEETEEKILSFLSRFFYVTTVFLLYILCTFFIFISHFLFNIFCYLLLCTVQTHITIYADIWF